MTLVESLQTWIPIIVGILTILTIVSGILYKAHKGFTKFIEEEIREVAKEFKPNGGSSLKDQVNRLENQHALLANKVDEIYDLLTTPTESVKIVKSKK